MLMAPPLSLYIHIPWCVSKCPYCDFNSHERRGAWQEAAYVNALIADLDADLRDFAFVSERRINSIFFGGGTPSLFAPDSIKRILDGCRQRLQLNNDCEITLEANPGAVEHGRFNDYAAAGVNRVSFGVQSFDDQALKRIGRIHSAEDAKRAIAEAQDAGIAEINLDLMYALPEQTLAAALFDIDAAIRLQPTHLSHYQLTLEPNTAFAARPPKLPDDDSAWEMEEHCQQHLAASGFIQYEISAYARDRHQCQHNLNYWQFGDYLGIGAGAHGKLTNTDAQIILRPWKNKHPRAYLEQTGSNARFGGCQPVAQNQILFEFMLNVLRLNQGFTWTDFEERSGLSRKHISPVVDQAVARGWLFCDSEGARATDFGRRFLNDLTTLFLP